jgi:CTP:molybdopterin cytidylyltransferase MocA
VTVRPVAAVILAAGEGKRFGGPKALVRLDRDLLVDRAVRVARESGCAPVVVVLGASAGEVVRTAALDQAVVVVNDAWATGMGSSLSCGLSAVSDHQAPAAVVLLVDQPSVGVATIRRLVQAWHDGARAAVASYNGQPRNPVVLDASTFAEVSTSAEGDVGARNWLRTHPEDVRAIACDDLGSDIDIDTPADLDRLRAMEDDTT